MVVTPAVRALFRFVAGASVQSATNDGNLQPLETMQQSCLFMILLNTAAWNAQRQGFCQAVRHNGA
jgi:hypothetical protein